MNNQCFAPPTQNSPQIPEITTEELANALLKLHDVPTEESLQVLIKAMRLRAAKVHAYSADENGVSLVIGVPPNLPERAYKRVRISRALFQNFLEEIKSAGLIRDKTYNALLEEIANNSWKWDYTGGGCFLLFIRERQNWLKPTIQVEVKYGENGLPAAYFPMALTLLNETGVEFSNGDKWIGEITAQSSIEGGRKVLKCTSFSFKDSFKELPKRFFLKVGSLQFSLSLKPRKGKKTGKGEELSPGTAVLKALVEFLLFPSKKTLLQVVELVGKRNFRLKRLSTFFPEHFSASFEVGRWEVKARLSPSPS